jgi:hypothetical protein
MRLILDNVSFWFCYMCRFGRALLHVTMAITLHFSSPQLNPTKKLSFDQVIKVRGIGALRECAGLVTIC